MAGIFPSAGACRTHGENSKASSVSGGGPGPPGPPGRPLAGLGLEAMEREDNISWAELPR